MNRFIWEYDRANPDRCLLYDRRHGTNHLDRSQVMCWTRDSHTAQRIVDALNEYFKDER